MTVLCETAIMVGSFEDQMLTLEETHRRVTQTMEISSLRKPRTANNFVYSFFPNCLQSRGKLFHRLLEVHLLSNFQEVQQAFRQTAEHFSIN